MNLSSGLSRKRYVTSTKNSQKSQNSKAKTISNQNKSKKSIVEKHSLSKEPELKKMPLSSKKSTLKMQLITETINSKNLKYSPEPSPSTTLLHKSHNKLVLAIFGEHFNNMIIMLT